MKHAIIAGAIALASLALAGCGKDSTGTLLTGAVQSQMPPDRECRYGVDENTRKCIVPEDANKNGQGRT